ncbi:MAG TPA: uracil-DNA glycosylase [Polyangium sp.]|nr:uracil-DNA glycosylase [Polyangium sp.]
MSLPRPALKVLHDELVDCRRCARLVVWREEVAETKRRAYRDEKYWGRPVPGFGDPNASLVLVGLAPGAHGANRTGRMFTGDRSGDFLYAALHRAGVASQPTSVGRNDGLELRDVFITAPCRCVPPDNKPLPEELETCRDWFMSELKLLPNARVFLALGKIGHDAILRLSKRTLEERGQTAMTLPAFAHGVSVEIPDPRGTGEKAWVLASYHVSQQNTQTGKLTPEMFDEVLSRALAQSRRR